MAANALARSGWGCKVHAFRMIAAAARRSFERVLISDASTAAGTWPGNALFAASVAFSPSAELPSAIIRFASSNFKMASRRACTSFGNAFDFNFAASVVRAPDQSSIPDCKRNNAFWISSWRGLIANAFSASLIATSISLSCSFCLQNSDDADELGSLVLDQVAVSLLRPFLSPFFPAACAIRIPVISDGSNTVRLFPHR